VKNMSNSNLETKLWSVSDQLRGNMDANEYKNYILGFIFYRYLSEKQEKTLNKTLEKDNITFKRLKQDSSLYEKVRQNALSKLGYFITPELLYSTIIEKIEEKEFILDSLSDAFDQITSSMGAESHEDYSNLFEDVNLN